MARRRTQPLPLLLLSCAIALCAGAGVGEGLFPETVAIHPLPAAQQLLHTLGTDVRNPNTPNSAVRTRMVRDVQRGGAVDARAQAQLMLVASIGAATAQDPEIRGGFLREALALHRGWRMLCEQSKLHMDGCQVVPTGGPRAFSCGDGQSWLYERFPCLPHRLWEASVHTPLEHGSAADADADAILAMVLLVVRFDGAGEPWWQQLGGWAYDSCRAFVQYDTQLSSSGNDRLVRLGSCRAGWGCATPSLFSVGHFRVLQRFMLDFAPVFGGSDPDAAIDEAEVYAAAWEQLIRTCYRVLAAMQTEESGLFPNWVVLSADGAVSREGASTSTECHESGSPPAQFGRQAAQAIFRVALDRVWFGDTWGDEAARVLRPIVAYVSAKLAVVAVDGCATLACHPEIALERGGLVRSIMPKWTEAAAMVGPLAAALTLPVDEGENSDSQQAALDVLAALLVRAHQYAVAHDDDDDSTDLR
eukprot:2035146-Pleurochrysis_carterae.AAC.1